jgi:hypothetical protein
MRWVISEPAPFLLRLELTVRCAHDTALREELATRVGAVPLAIRRLIENATQDQAVSLSISAEELAAAFQALSLGLALEALGNPGAVQPGLIGDVAALLVDVVESRNAAHTP